jgi:2-polyprenyl-3-methyl-5-hydroxy-6-metoxy-1,4-benzoquinol methylase
MSIGPPDRSQFDAAYEQGTAPWDIGHPQPALAARSGTFRGAVLDVGCGTGEHALLAASLGLPATGVDRSPAAINLARAKAVARSLDATFVVGEVTELTGRFDTVVDCGLFHVLDDLDRAAFLTSLTSVVAPGGRYTMLAFSERQPGDWGPRRISRDDVLDSFRDGWRIESIDPAEILVNGMDPAKSWLTTVERV